MSGGIRRPAGAPLDPSSLDPYERTDRLHPPLNSPAYGSSALRHPKQPLVLLPHRLTELTGPLLGADRVRPGDADLTIGRGPAAGSDGDETRGIALGQRIIVSGRVLDSDGRPVPQTLVEIWQANAAGRYRHPVDQWPAPLDPHFDGLGRCLTDSTGRWSFTTIKPGAYPWRNHHNAWRPAHIHFSLLGRSFTQRLVTQMYFPDDPLFDFDPILGSVPGTGAQRLISRFDLDRTRPDWALAFEWDIVLRGRQATPFEDGAEHDE